MTTHTAAPAAVAAPQDLGDLLDLYTAEPGRWRPVLYCYIAQGEVGLYAGPTLGPIQLKSPPDDADVWRGLASRMGAPGRAVVRLMRSQAKAEAGGHVQCAVELTAAMYAEYTRADAAPRQQQQPVAPAPLVTQQPPASTDMVSVVLQAMQQNQQLILELARGRTDPSVEVLRMEIKRLSDELSRRDAQPAKTEKADREEWVDLGKQLAGAASSDGAVIANVLASPPLVRLAEAISKRLETSAEVDLCRAETMQMEAAAKAEAAGVKLQPAGHGQVEQGGPAAE